MRTSGSTDSLLGDRPRRPRFRKSGAPYLVPALLALAAAVALWLGWGALTRIPASLEAPETQIRRALANQPRAHLDDVYGFKAGGTADLWDVRYADVTSMVDPGKAEVLAMVEATGRVAWREDDATVTYLGRERFRMTPCAIALWCADGTQFARLRGVLTVLFRRVDAIQGGDAAAYARLVSEQYQGGKAAVVARLSRALAEGPAPKVDVVGWQIRVERDRAVVGEDHRIRSGDGASQPLRERFELAREGDRWVFVSGL